LVVELQVEGLTGGEAEVLEVPIGFDGLGIVRGAGRAAEQ
jgi:hypothetical protein